MSDYETPDDVLIRRWVRGELDGRERRAFETRLASEPELAARARLQGAIEDSLRRIFTPPANPLPPAVAQAEAVFAEASPSRAASRAWWPAAGLAAAVLLLVLYAIGQRSRDQGPSETPEIAQGETPVDPPSSPRGLERAPDIQDPSCQNVYSVVGALGHGESEAATAAPWCTFEELSAADDLAGILALRHDQSIELTSEASSQLMGPFDLAEWPSASVLVGYPVELAGRPVVLVVDHEANHCTCSDLTDPSRDGLQAFVWRVGKLRVTEITPDSEPRFLQQFSLR